MKDLVFSVGFGFGGSAGGAFGFQQAETHLLGVRAKFRVVGSFDNDEKACRNWAYLTGTEQTCVDARELTPAMLRAIYGETAPDAFFCSAPCQGASALLSEERAATDHYQALNELALVWTGLMLNTWNPGPRVVLWENVPNLTSRAPEVIAAVKALMTRAGYIVNDGAHELGTYAPGGHYNAGVLGGLAQNRKRWLLMARDPKRCSPLLFKPTPRRVRGVGEVLGPLPMPGDPAGGPMHALPRLSTMNWIRLALTRAGGDWRDIPDVRAELLAKMEADEVCDPRIQCSPRAGAYGVIAWADPSTTVTASLHVDNGKSAVADPRVEAFNSGYGVIPWDESSGTVTGQARASNGAFSVADPRPKVAFDKGYAVLAWDAPSNTVAGTSNVGCGTYSVADPREKPEGVWLTLDEAKKLLIGPGPWAIVDKNSDGPPVAIIHDLRKPSPFPILIIAEDGTWHRPLTVLELAVLQGLPATHNGKPLQFTGPATTDREHIGNLVPPPAACAIAEQVLLALAQHELGAFSLSGAGGIWVEPDMEAAALQ